MKATTSLPHGTRRRQRGIALLLVVWVFMILGVLALDFGRFTRDDASAALNFSDETRGYYVAIAGMNKAIWSVIKAREEGRDPSDAAESEAPGRRMRRDVKEKRVADEVFDVDAQWHPGTFHDARFEVRMIDQGGLFPINLLRRDNVAVRDVFKRVLTGLLVGSTSSVKGQSRRDTAEIDGILDAITDWMDADTAKHPNGAESEYYLGLRPPYRAKNARLDSVDELLMIRGVTPELYFGVDGMPGLRDLVSVYGANLINTRTAPPILLGLIFGKDADGVAELEAEQGGDPQAFFERIQAEATRAGVFPMFHQVDPYRVLVEARADVAQERNRASVAAVWALPGGPGVDAEQPRVLMWYDRAPWSGLAGALPPFEDAAS